jgi:hypothetical protein
MIPDVNVDINILQTAEHSSLVDSEMEVQTVEKKQQIFEDFVMIRYKDCDEVRVLKEDEFNNEFHKRLNDPCWRRVELV